MSKKIYEDDEVIISRIYNYADYISIKDLPSFQCLKGEGEYSELVKDNEHFFVLEEKKECSQLLKYTFFSQSEDNKISFLSYKMTRDITDAELEDIYNFVLSLDAISFLEELKYNG